VSATGEEKWLAVVGSRVGSDGGGAAYRWTGGTDSGQEMEGPRMQETKGRKGGGRVDK
jgi:hypothetical protein